MSYDISISEIIKAMSKLDEWYNSRNREYKHHDLITKEFLESRKIYIDLIGELLPPTISVEKMMGGNL